MQTGDGGNLLINLDEVSLSEVLARRDTALAQAVRREQTRRENSDDDRTLIAGFNNFVGGTDGSD